MKGSQISLFSNTRLCADPEISRALVIREPWAGMILSGAKTWEIRGSNTRIRGPIAIIAGGTGKIFGVCDLVEAIGPLSIDEYTKAYHQRGGTMEQQSSLPYERTYAWVMARPSRLSCPLAYQHPNGAVIWVHLQSQVKQNLRQALCDSTPVES